MGNPSAPVLMLLYSQWVSAHLAPRWLCPVRAEHVIDELRRRTCLWSTVAAASAAIACVISIRAGGVIVGNASHDSIGHDSTRQVGIGQVSMGQVGIALR